MFLSLLFKAPQGNSLPLSTPLSSPVRWVVFVIAHLVCMPCVCHAELRRQALLQLVQPGLVQQRPSRPAVAGVAAVAGVVYFREVQATTHLLRPSAFARLLQPDLRAVFVVAYQVGKSHSPHFMSAFPSTAQLRLRTFAQGLQVVCPCANDEYCSPSPTGRRRGGRIDPAAG